MPHDFDDDQTRSFTNVAVGTKVSHYTIVSKIGSGGMGDVYLAQDSQLDRKVALKFLPPHLSQIKDSRARFAREAKAAAKLDHPNIVPVYEVGEYKGRPFFAMAHIDGRPLRDVIKQGKLTINDAIDLTMQICEGLHRAHESGVVHRDIKPGNIIVDQENRPRILDFGLATVSGEEKLTKTGSTLGTVGYMSPEQIEGEEVDHRSDLFSVGVILYEMITGRLPFEGDNDVAVAHLITGINPEPIARFKSDVTEELQHVVDKTLTKDPALRYQHADDMLTHLKRLNAEYASGIANRPSKRWTKIIPVSGIVLMILIAALVLRPWRFEIQPRDETLAASNLLAIMYFDNLADPDDSQNLGKITTNLLITDLSESRYVKVVSNQRLVDALKSLGIEGQRITPSIATQVAERSRATWMMTGSILRVEPNLVLTTQVVETRSGTSISSRQFNGVVGEDIFSLVDRITIEIKNDLELPSAGLEKFDRPISDITTKSTDAYRSYLEGMQFYRNFDYRAAERGFLKALEYDSNFALAYYGLSLAWVHNNQLEMIGKAVERIDHVSRKERLLILAGQARIEDDYDSSVFLLKQITEHYPDEKEVYFELGVIVGNLQHKHEESIEYLLKAIEIDSEYAPTYNYLAFCYDYLGNIERSEWAINRYAEFAPNEFNPLDTRAELYGRRGNLDLAIEYYNRAISINPTSHFTQLYLGHMYLFKMDFENADTCFNNVAYAGINRMQSLAGLYRSYIPIYKGEFDKALIMLDESITADKLLQYRLTWHEGKYHLKAWLYHMMGDHERACEATLLSFKDHFDEEMDELHWNCNGNLVYLLDKNGMAAKADEIIEHEEKILTTNDTKDNRASHLKSKGMLAFARQDFNNAVLLLKSAMETYGYEPHDYCTPYFLALAYYRNGQLAEAVEQFESIMQIYEYEKAFYSFLSIQAYYWLGRAYEESGWSNKAIEQYETFLYIWKSADHRLEAIEDTKVRLVKLRASI